MSTPVRVFGLGDANYDLADQNASVVTTRLFLDNNSRAS